MFTSSVSYGLNAVMRRKGLVFLAYGMNLVLAFVLAVPVFVMVQDAVGPTGFGPDLVRQFDAVLWADILADIGTALGSMWAQLLWLIPLYLLWKVALSVGLIHALRDGAVRPFWAGVGRYTGRGLLVALVFLIPLIAWIVGVVVVGTVMGTVWGGEVGTFWNLFVITPTLIFTGLAVVDLMHDYARIALVVEEQGVWEACMTGLAWPFRHGGASWIYLAWFAAALVLVLLPTVFEFSLKAVWGLFLIQQLCLLLRAGATVGWFGSEVHFFEVIRERERPLIADAEAAAPAPEGGDLSPGDTPDGLALA
jgi:hypothetical protein